MTDTERAVINSCFRKAERIRTRPEISRVFNNCVRYSTKNMRFCVRANGSADTRAVFITVKKYGNAVCRNRARRVVSECWRLAKHRVKQGYDVVVLIYPDNDCFAYRNEQLEFLLNKASLIKK